LRLAAFPTVHDNSAIELRRDDHLMRVSCRFLAVSLLVSPSVWAESPDVSGILGKLESVHSISEVALSPDGRRVVYGTSITGKKGGADVDVAALWLADAKDGSSPMRLTACPGSVCDEHGAVWSPDGKSIAFVTTDAHDQTQIAVAAAATREVRVITAAHGPLDTPRWSPDGGLIGFLYAEGAPKTPGPLNPLSRDAGVLSQTVFEQRLAVISSAGGAPRLLGPADLNVYEFDWSPDGRRFAVTAAHGSGDDNWWLAELDVINADSGGVTTLSRPTLQMASPRWSGDGRRVAYIGGIMSDEGATGGDVYVIDAAGGDPVDVTPDLPASVQTVTWNGASGRIIATEFAAGDEVLAVIDVNAKTQHEIWRAPEMIWANSLEGFAPGDLGISLSKNGEMSAVIRQSYTSPPEVETGPPGKWRPITWLNSGVERLTGKAANITWTNDGMSVQGMLIEPPSVVPGRRYPLLVDVHGGPAYAHYPIFPAGDGAYDAVLAHAGYFIFQPNPRGSYGEGERFTRANVKDFGYGDLRDILSGLDAVERRAPIDPARAGIFGWSYGGYMTMWTLTQTDRFKAAVAGAGISDWLSYYGTNNIDTWMLPYFGASVYDDPKVYERSSPMTFIKSVHTPTLILSGDRDAEVPISQSYEYWNALKRDGVKVEFVVYPDEGHHFFRHADEIDRTRRVVEWFDANLGAGGR
jgi:dipeptidyl aminopeptidase/acylaminoacyl peptidase